MTEKPINEILDEIHFLSGLPDETDRASFATADALDDLITELLIRLRKKEKGEPYVGIANLKK